MTRWKAVILRPDRSTSAGERVSLCWFPKGLARPRHGSLLGRFCLVSKTFSLFQCLKPKHMDQRMIAQRLLYPVMPVIFPLQCHTLSFSFIPFQQPIMECLALFDRALIESRVTHTQHVLYTTQELHFQDAKHLWMSFWSGKHCPVFKAILAQNRISLL